MSLKKDFVIKGNVTVSDSIIKIEDLVVVNGQSVSLRVCVYNSQSEKISKDAAYECRFTVEGDDYSVYFGEQVLKLSDNSVLSQGYVYLKTLPDFSGAEDI